MTGPILEIMGSVR